MKKIILLGMIIAFYLFVGKVAADTELIPKDAIRIRVIGNSNSEEDQLTKRQIKQQLELYYYDLLKDTKGSNQASLLISNSLTQAREIISQFTNDFTLSYGMNYFPQKVYKGITYDEGYYDSLVVTLGSGNGKNWWCVLFPPLCLMENESMGEVEYRSLVADLVEKYF